MSNDWLKEKLQYNELSHTFESVFTFYGDYYKSLFISDVSLMMNDKKARKALGTFAPYILEITLNEVKSLIQQNQLGCVIVHEMAHFIDHERRNKNSRYTFSSSRHGSKERVIAELFRSKMSPVPQKRTNYRGRTCELFARAIEEFYAITTKNEAWIRQYAKDDYYVNLSDYNRVIFPVVENYMKEIIAM